MDVKECSPHCSQALLPLNHAKELAKDVIYRIFLAVNIWIRLPSPLKPFTAPDPHVRPFP